MESIQLAQMLADLSDLNAAEARAAVALVNANKTLEPPPTSTPGDTKGLEPQRPGQRHHHRVGSASSILSRTASPAKYDKLGRRLNTPPLTRANSAQGSIPGTPRSHEPEDDVDRATSLMALYELRAKLKQQDSANLNKLREKIAALQARQQQQLQQPQHQQTEALEKPQIRFTYPKSA